MKLLVMVLAQVAWGIPTRPEVTIGSRDSGGPASFAGVSGLVRLGSGTIVVADRQSRELRFFGPGGRAIRVAGRSGAGPGEFRLINSLHRCARDSLVVFDGILGRISVFSPDGRYVRAMDPRGWSASGLPPRQVGCNAKGAMAVIHRSPEPPVGVGPRRPRVRVALVFPRGAVTDLGEFPASERYFLGAEDIPRPFGKVTSAAIGRDELYVGTGDAFSVTRYGLDGRPRGTIAIPTAARRVTREAVDRYIDARIARSGSPSGRGGGMESTLRSLSYPSHFPPYRRLLVDPADRLWVEDYPVSGEEPARFLVFAPDGGLLATVTTPPRFEVWEVGEDYVLGVWRDEFDVEYVRLYRLAGS